MWRSATSSWLSWRRWCVRWRHAGRTEVFDRGRSWRDPFTRQRPRTWLGLQRGSRPRHFGAPRCGSWRGAWWRWPEQREGGVCVDVAAEAPAASERGRRSTRSSRGSGSRPPSLRPVDPTAPRDRPRRRRPARPNAGGHPAPPRGRQELPVSRQPVPPIGRPRVVDRGGMHSSSSSVRSSAPSSASNRCRTSRLCSVLIP